MKKVIGTLVILIGMYASSCKKSDTETGYTPDCSGASPTFAAKVSPLVLSSCATSGCHNTGSNNGPGALVSYAQIKSASSSIRSSVVSGRMPKGTTLTDSQKNTIVCWIDAGALNN